MTKRVPLTKEFEREAVRLAETSGRTQKEIAADLGIGLSTLTRWISRNRDATIDDPELIDANEDMVAELRRRLINFGTIFLLRRALRLRGSFPG
ncbi:helix-turn-helix domain-containing protein, partial [Brucella melitensis]